MTGAAIPSGGAVALPRPANVTLGEAFWVWFRIAALSFGGPPGRSR